MIADKVNADEGGREGALGYKGGMYARQSAPMAILRPLAKAMQQNRRNLEKVSSRAAARLFRQARPSAVIADGLCYALYMSHIYPRRSIFHGAQRV